MRSVGTRPDRALLITGEAGIGKTHLARHAVTELADDGFTVAWGRANAVERAIPYTAIGQVLAALPGYLPTHEWESASRRGADTVRREIHAPVAEWLEAQCVGGPLVVVVDDLHHADEDTLVLLGFLVRRLAGIPVMWVTERPAVSDPAFGLATLLHRLRADDRLDELVLGRLPPADIALLAESTVGRPLSPAVVNVVVERAAGNPFFAIQVALALAESGALEGPVVGAAQAAVLSASRRIALLERVFPLGQGARAVARLAAVFGDLDVAQLPALAPVLGVDAVELDDGFDRLVHADLLRAVSPRRYGFVHDLVRETLYDDLGPAERRRMHGVAAASLLERRAGGESIDVVELAHHLSHGSPQRDRRAADALRDAGDALVVTAPHSAALRYRQAIDHHPAAGGDLYVAWARALRRAGESGETVRVCRLGLDAATGTERDRLTRYLASALADTGALGDALRVVDERLAERPDSLVLLTTMALLHRQLEDCRTASCRTSNGRRLSPAARRSGWRWSCNGSTSVSTPASVGPCRRCARRPRGVDPGARTAGEGDGPLPCLWGLRRFR